MLVFLFAVYDLYHKNINHLNNLIKQHKTSEPSNLRILQRNLILPYKSILFICLYLNMLFG